MESEVWSGKEAVRSEKCEVWSAKSAVCSVRCGVSREGHGRGRVSLNYRSFMFGKLPPPACPGLCYPEYSSRAKPTDFVKNHDPIDRFKTLGCL